MMSPVSAEEKMLELNLPSGVEYLPLVDSLCQAFCQWTGMSRDITDDMAIAVVEAATNAVVHGNKSDKSKRIHVVFKRRPSEIRVSVADEGPGFTPGDVANPLAAGNMLKESGRGIYIMKHIMDRVDFDFPADGGTRVRMTKCLTCEKGRILCVDYGRKRIGLALSDELCIIARPLKVIETERTRDVVGEICATAAANQVGEIVVGLPLTLKGEVSLAASEAAAFAAKLGERSGLPIETVDERLSTKQSEKILIQSGMRRHKRKRKVDALAAAIILQGYLDAAKERCLEGA
ncbi:MAG: Holliday junction resolvase RuvX [bacterium]